MRLFWELTKTSFQRHLTYRAATVAGFITNFFFGILRATILIALYNIQPSVQGISVDGAITYAALGQALIGFLSIFQWYDLMNTVITGDVASDMLKPMNYYLYWMAKDLGRALVQLILRGVILLAGFSVIYKLIWPRGAFQILFLFLSLILGWVISFTWRFLINLTSFWTPDARGILRFSFVISWFLTGFLMPLRFYPDWIVRIAYLTPFPYMFNTIIEIYLGVVTGQALVESILLQAAWALGLITLGQIVMRSGIRKLVIQGG